MPKLRFKGFTDDWEQRKLENLAEVKDSARIPNDEWTESGVPYIRASDISNDDLSGVLFISKDKYEFYKERTGAPNKNDVLFNGGGEIGKAVLKEDDSPVYVQGGAVLYVRTSESEHLCGDYLVSYFSTKSAEQYIEVASAGGTMKHYTLKPAQNMPVVFPGAEEQEKIGAYFTELDNLIALHQRKCDELQKVKKYMLQKMFPKKGEKVPEIRFTGFTGDWEQRKLGEVFEQTTNFINPSESDVELWSLTVEAGLTPKTERYNREFLVKKEDNFKEVRPGDIVYNPMNMTLGAVGYNGMSQSVAVSGYYTTMITKDGYDSYYINTWLKSPQAILLYKNYATGSLLEKQRVQFPTLSSIPALFPDYEEQNKIGAYFSNLDNLITLHQRKHETLKEIKKYMLQNMFPKK